MVEKEEIPICIIKAEKEAIEGQERRIIVELNKEFLNNFDKISDDIVPKIRNVPVNSNWGNYTCFHQGKVFKSICIFTRSANEEDEIIEDVRRELKDALLWLQTRARRPAFCFELYEEDVVRKEE